MTEISKKAELVELMTNMVPGHCRRLEDICPLIGNHITRWAHGFDELPDKERATRAERAVRTMEGLVDECILGLGVQASLTHPTLKCRRAKIFGGKGDPLVSPESFEQQVPTDKIG